MKVEAQTHVDAPLEPVWKVITDIEGAGETIHAIEELEVLEKPESGLVGLKWRETRTVFGKTATETMWITEAVENDFYKTRAESHGCVYLTTLSVSEEEGGTLLRMSLKGEAQTFGAKLMSAVFSVFFKGGMRKAIEQDLADIKATVEAG